MSTKDDPRLPSAATRLPKASAETEESAPTIYGIAGMMLGLWGTCLPLVLMAKSRSMSYFSGLMGRNKIACWAALFACLANIANMKTVRLQWMLQVERDCT